MTTLYTRYRELRQKYPTAPAKVLVQWARTPEVPAFVAEGEFTLKSGGDLFGGDSWTGTIDRFTVTIRVEIDDYPDKSLYGEWTDDSEGGALRNPDADWSTYKYFRANEANLPTPADLFRTGMSRSNVDRAIAEARKQAMQAAKEDEFVVYVGVRRKGIELGSTNLGGCTFADEDDMFRVVDEHGMIRDAIGEARDMLRSLCEGAQ